MDSPSRGQGTFSASSGKLAASAVVFALPCRLSAVQVISNGAADATVTVYDHATAASGKILFEVVVVGADRYGGRNWSFPVIADNGLYCEISGIGAAAIVEYIK